MKDTMRILFLSHYFPPEVNAPASRTYEHCRQWVKDGHEVTVVTCVPNHPQGTVYEGYRNKLIQWENQDGISVVRLWTYVTANEGFLKRTVNYISFMVAAILSVPFLPGYDITLSTSPQFFNGLAGYVVSRLKRTPWILEIRDLWPDSIVAVGAITNRTIIGLLEALELFAYRRADHIVVVTDSFKTTIQAKGIGKQKITVIKNGVDSSLYSRPTDNPASLAAQIGVEGKFVASYMGTHGMAHHLETVLEAAYALREWRDIVFLLVGSGAERDRLLSMKDSMHLSNVVMLDQQPKTAMPHFWSLSNVSLILLKKSELFKTVIPSKIFESMAMERPIILGVEGESRELLRCAEAGVSIEPENAKELADQVLNLYQNPRRCQELGSNGRKYVLENFDRLVLAKRFADLMQIVCK